MLCWNVGFYIRLVAELAELVGNGGAESGWRNVWMKGGLVGERRSGGRGEEFVIHKHDRFTILIVTGTKMSAFARAPFLQRDRSARVGRNVADTW